MKSKLAAFAAVLCIASLVNSDAIAKGKPDKQDKPSETNTECIIFDGDLIGGESVQDCCPNAGPFPEYGMALAGTYYDGQLFINNYGAGRNHKYIVQFWNDDIGFEIIGGVIDDDKKNKILTVTFADEQGTLWENGVGETPLTVSFVLLRTSDLSYCP